jgi:tape measure domain-containing protein
VLNLGQINFGLGVDTAALSRATSQVVQFGRVVENAARAQGAGARAAEAALRRQEAAALGALQSTLRMNDSIRKNITGQQQATMLRATTNAFRQLSDQMTQGQRTTIAYQRAMESFGARMGTIQRQIKALTSNANVTPLGNMLKDVASATVLAIGPLSGFGARIAAIAAISTRSSFAMAALVTTVVSMGVAFGKLSSATITNAIAIDRIRARLENATGSVEGAEDQLNDLREMADRTGLRFIDLAEQFSRFQAAAVGTSLEGAKAREIFENLATAVGKFQLDAASAEGVFRAVEQMMSKGNVTAEELRQQLGDRLPGAFKAAADALGVTTAKLNELLKKGKVSAEQFLIPFSREVRKRLGGDSVEGVQSLTASLNRLNTAWTFFLKNFDEAFGISKAFQAAVDSLSSGLNLLGNNIKGVVAIVGALTGAFALLALPRIIAGVNAGAIAFRAMTLAATGLGAVLAVGTLASWVGLFTRIAVIVGSAALALNGFSTSANQAAAADRELKAGADAFIESQNRQNVSVQQSAKVFTDAIGKKIEGLHLQLLAMQKVEMAQQDFIKNFDNSGAQWFDKGLDEWAARLLSGMKQNKGGMQSQIKPVITDLDELKKRFDKLQEIGNRPVPLDIGGEKLDRAGRALRDANQEIQKLALQNQKMLEGPSAFAKFERTEEITQKVQNFRDRLTDAGLAVDVVKQKVAEYQFVLENNIDITDNAFKNMSAAVEAFKGIATNSMNSVADAIGKAVAEGKFSADTFVSIVKDMVAQIISQILKMAIINPILNSIFGLTGAGAMPTFPGLGNMFGFAKGGAFSGGVQFMAKGGILGQPTMFGTRRGMAVGGEAGDEAVMPLIRSSTGHLGVRAVGSQAGGNNGRQIVNVITPPGANVEQKQRRTAGGEDTQDIIISVIDRAIAGGKMDKSLGARFGGRNRLAGVG